MEDLTSFINIDKNNKQYPILFNFKLPYFKLSRNSFTTIRSTKYNKKHSFEKGDLGWIFLNLNKFKFVSVKDWEDKRICDIPLKVLQKDANYPGHYILSHEDFVDLLNEFSIETHGFGNHTLNTTKRIFYLKTIRRNM